MSNITSPESQIIRPDFTNSILSTISSQVVGNAITGNPTSTSPTISYMLDGVTGVAAAWSLRRLKTDYTGNAVEVENQTTSDIQQFGFTGEDFDSSGLDTFLSDGGDIGNILSWYDQSGNSKDSTNATTATQPLIDRGGLASGDYAINMANGGSERLFFSSTPLTDYTVMAVYVQNARSGTTTNTVLSGTASTDLNIYLARGTVNRIGSTQNTSNRYSEPAAVANLSTNQYTITGSSVIRLNASDTTLVTSNTVTGNLTTIGIRPGASTNILRGWLAELIIFNRVLSGAELTSLETNQKSYWGTP